MNIVQCLDCRKSREKICPFLENEDPLSKWAFFFSLFFPVLTYSLSITSPSYYIGIFWKINELMLLFRGTSSTILQSWFEPCKNFHEKRTFWTSIRIPRRLSPVILVAALIKISQYDRDETIFAETIMPETNRIIDACFLFISIW